MTYQSVSWSNPPACALTCDLKVDFRPLVTTWLPSSSNTGSPFSSTSLTSSRDLGVFASQKNRESKGAGSASNTRPAAVFSDSDHDPQLVGCVTPLSSVQLR